MPLSEEEQRLLEQMERALVEEDPKLASTMRGTTLRATARRRALLAAVVFLAGVAVLMTGAVTKVIVVGIIGFMVMLAAAYVGLSAWRGQNQPPEQPGPEPGSPPTFSVVDGGRTKKRAARGSRGRSPGRSSGRSPSQGSMMERLEARWRRRRDQNGY